jgi:hypothetical protein
MTPYDVATPERKRPGESGLDTSNGLEFVQQRIVDFSYEGDIQRGARGQGAEASNPLNSLALTIAAP